MPAPDRRPKKSGGAKAAAADLVPIQVLVTPAEREELRVAAAMAGLRGMAAFLRRTGLAAAREAKGG